MKITSMKKVKNVTLCILAAFAVCLLNYSLNFLAVKTLRLPLFLDTLFTCSIAFALSPLPGIFISILSFFIASTIHYILFGVLGNFAFVFCIIAEILLIYGFRRRLSRQRTSLSRALLADGDPADYHPADREGQREPYSLISTASSLLLLYLLTCITISLVGGIIDWAGTVVLGTGDHETLSYTFFKIGLLRNRLPLLAANILSRIPVNIVDRFITIFGGYGLGLLLRRILEKKKHRS
jgi:hypothetical protein